MSKFEFFYFLSSLAEILYMGQFKGADLKFEPKNPISIQFRREKPFFWQIENFGQSLLKKSIAKASPLVTVNIKLFQMIPHT